MTNILKGPVQGHIFKYLIGGSDTKTSDVIIQCSDGVMPTHKLVLASISKMFKAVFKEDTWDEPISVIIPDSTLEETSMLMKDIYKGFDNSKNLETYLSLALALGILKANTVKVSNPSKSHTLLKNITSAVKQLNKEDPKEKMNVTMNNTKFDDSIDNNLINEVKEELYPDIKLIENNSDIEHEEQFFANSIKESERDDDDRPQSKAKKIRTGIQKINSAAKNQYFDFHGDPSKPDTATCKLCGKEMKSKSRETSYHMRVFHNEIYSTFTAMKEDRSRKASEYYYLKEDDTGKAVCYLCGIELLFGNIYRHLAQKHQIGGGYTLAKNQTYVCPKCGKEIKKSNIPALKKHKLGNCHQSSGECPKCGKAFEERRNKKCPCGWVNQNWGKDKKYICNLCGEQFCQESSLTKHTEICKQYADEGLTKGRVCRGCNREFARFAELRKHILYSTVCSNQPDQRIPCTQCNKKFLTEKLLNIHMRVHTGETPFHCQTCDRKFKFASQYNNHKCQ